MNILLIIIVFIFLLCLFNGYRNGFLRTVFALMSWVLIVFVVKSVVPDITNYIIENSQVGTSIEETLVTDITGMITEMVDNAGIEELEKSMPGLMSVLGYEGVDIHKVTEEIVTKGFSEELFLNISTAVYGVISIVLTVIVVFLCKVVLYLCSFVFKITEKLPIIGPLDKFLGLLCGLGNGYIWICIILTVVTMLARTGVNTEFAAYISQSPILIRLQEYNFFLNLINWK